MARSSLLLRARAALLVGALAGGAPPAAAQVPPPPARPGALPAPAAAPPAGPDVALDGIVVDAPIVAGNAANAKAKALGEAFRQGVERVFVRALAESGVAPDAPLPPGLAALRGTFSTGARRFVRSHRLLESAEVDGNYRVRVVADVDEAALRREIDRARGGGASARPVLVGVAGPAAAGGSVVGALAALGLKAEVRSLAEADPAQVRALAGTGGGAALLVSSSAVDEGNVRGTNAHAVSCRLALRVVSASEVGGERIAEKRGFDTRPEAAQTACFQDAARALVTAAAGELAPIAAAGAGGARAVRLELDVVEPAAVAPVLRAIRKIGSVSSSEVRRVRVGRVDVRALTRLSGADLAAALRRELGPTFVVNARAAEPDRAELEIRFAPPPPPGVPPPAAPPAPGGPGQ
jgi:hypothetical protein